MRVVGLDLSLTSTGAASIARYPEPIVRTWRFRFKGKTPVDPHARLDYLLDSVNSVCSLADLAIIEDMPYGAKGSAVHAMAGLQWIIRQELHRMGVPYVTVNTMQRAKWITGTARSGKDECLAAVIKRFPGVDVRGNDEADALTLAAMAADWLGFPLAAMPADRAAVLDRVEWPATLTRVVPINREETA